MKRTLFFLVITCTALLRSNAMSYEEAQQRAWYLTDKMAYELDLTSEQCEKAYEINLDYMLNIATPDDAYGPYWTYRNTDFRFVLFDWQYTRFTSIAYFYRPLRWLGYRWHCLCYDHYRPGLFYFKQPLFVSVYRGRSFRNIRHYRSPYRHISMRHAPGLRTHHYASARPAMPPAGNRPGNFHIGKGGKMEWKGNNVRSEAPGRNPSADRKNPTPDKPTFYIGNRGQGSRPDKSPANMPNRNQGNATSSNRPGRSNQAMRPSTGSRSTTLTRPSDTQRNTSLRNASRERKNNAPGEGRRMRESNQRR